MKSHSTWTGPGHHHATNYQSFTANLPITDSAFIYKHTCIQKMYICMFMCEHIHTFVSTQTCILWVCEVFTSAYPLLARLSDIEI